MYYKPSRSRIKCKDFICIFFLYILAQSEKIYGLTVTPEHVNVDVGAHPTFTCSIKKAANFLIEHTEKFTGPNKVLLVFALSTGAHRED
jgi:hypothetical protein